MMKQMVLVSKERNLETYRLLAFPRAYCCLGHSLKSVKKQVEVGWAYILQPFTVDPNCFKDLPFKPMQRSYSRTLEMIKTLKILDNDVRGIHTASLDILKFNFLDALKHIIIFIFVKLYRTMYKNS